ncbi:MAG: bacteriohemerythrin [Pseudomonadota bacterium]
MALKPYQQKILELYEDQERQLAMLYSCFGRQFPNDNAFWGQLVREEEMHARLISKLNAAVDTGALLFDEGKVKTYTLSAMIERLDVLRRKAEAGQMDRRGALAQALDLESALIEKGVFTHFEALNDKARVVLKRLNGETLDHVARVRRMRDADADAPRASVLSGDRSPAGQAATAVLEWTPALSVNDDRLDRQHQLLFAIINDLADLRAKGGERRGIIDLITRMIGFSDAHFGCEDEVMLDADFPLFASHRREHQQFMERVGQFLEGYQQRTQDLTGEMMAFLQAWWLNHTAESDRRYARWIQKRQSD